MVFIKTCYESSGNEYCARVKTGPKKFVLDIGKTTAKLMQHFNKKTVGKNEFFLSLILYYLSERKHDFDQLTEKLDILDTEIDLDALLSLLRDNNFIEKIDDYYKIKIDKLF